MSKNFDETVRPQSDKREEWIQEIRRERLQGIAEGARSALRLASSLAVSFPGRNECPGTHCSLIQQEEREDSSCQICHRVLDKKDGGEDGVTRTERESDSRRRLEKWQTCWCCQDQQRVCRMAQASAEKLKHTGPAEKERVASVHRESSWQECRSCPCQKEKEQSRLSKAPDHEWGESQGVREPHLGERGGSEREHGVERVDSTVNEGRFQVGQGGQARRASLEQVEGSMSG